jgi:hypothetical protein
MLLARSGTGMFHVKHPRGGLPDPGTRERGGQGALFHVKQSGGGLPDPGTGRPGCRSGNVPRGTYCGRTCQLRVLENRAVQGQCFT